MYTKHTSQSHHTILVHSELSLDFNLETLAAIYPLLQMTFYILFINKHVNMQSTFFSKMF